MPLLIDQESKVPLYYQLKEELKKKILKGEFKEGDVLPSERELSEQNDISSTTIRRALNDLVHENFLERKAGKGPFVRMGKIKRDRKSLTGASKKGPRLHPKHEGDGPCSLNAGPEQESDPDQYFLHGTNGPKKGDKVVKLERLRLANDVPMMLETRYIRTDFCPGIEKRTLFLPLENF